MPDYEYIIESWINGQKKQMIEQINEVMSANFAEWLREQDHFDNDLKIKIYEHYLINS